MSLAGVVLAGGASRRMGRPKALLAAPEGTWLDRAVARLAEAGASPIWIAGGAPEWVPAGASYLADRRPGQGPLAGIEAAMERSRAEGAARGEGVGAGRWCLVLACDLPRIDRETLSRLVQERDRSLERGSAPSAVVAVGSSGLEPLVALYHDSLLPELRAFLDSGRRSARAFLESLGPRTSGPRAARVEVSPDLLWNANTPEDLEGDLEGA